MSSDSELDEFFDAEEATPNKIQRQVSNKLLEEEKKILEAKKIAEERRREEDVELERKLAEIEEMKQHELDQTEAERRAIENEKRRKKLEEMRESMAEDGSPIKPPPKPPRLDSDGVPLDTPEEKSKSTPLEESIVINKSVEISMQEPNIQPDASSTTKTNSGRSDVDADVSDIILDNLNTPECDRLKVQSKNIPELVHPEVNDNSSDNNSVATMSSPEEPAAPPEVSMLAQQVKPEPDIIQSTKKEPPPRPVAPPRTKRNKAVPPRPPPPAALKPSGSIDKAPEVVPSTSASSKKGLPTELSKGPSPTSTVLGLTKDFEHSLSIDTATCGSRMVTAKEDVSAKAEKTEEEKENEAAAAATVTAASSLSNTPTNEQPGNLSNDSDEKKDDTEVKNTEEEAKKMRPRSNSGSRFLTDEEILAQVMVLNLDTGESIPLSQAEDKLPQCVNPLSLHIMRRTKEYSSKALRRLAEIEAMNEASAMEGSDSSLHKHRGSDDEGKGGHSKTTKTIMSIKPAARRKTQKMKKLFSKGFTKLKTAAGDMLHGHDRSDDDDEEFDERSMIKVKASSANKGPYDFDLLVPVQDLKGEQNGAIWTMKFSHCGRLLATGGQDNLLRVWVLKDSYAYFDDMRQKYSEANKVSPTPSQDSLSSQASEASAQSEAVGDSEEDEHAPFMRKPFCVYRGHTADLLDLSWSKNYFILSSSMDKTVRLWHAARKECLCCFQHIDFVTAIAFHPRDDRYFLSGSLDGKMRLWSIPDKKVALWNEVIGQSKLITAASFCLGGKFAVCGTYDGRCIFYSTEQLKYFTQIHVRSTRGKNARGRKITGIECLPGEDKILVTSNDSRIRMYDLRDLTLTCKYKGCANNSSQIKASFSHNGKYIICGSEDHFVYIWKTQHDFYKFTSARRDRNDFWEGIKAHNAVVTVAIFAPNPALIIRPQFEFLDSDAKERSAPEVRGEVLISADFGGSMKVFINKFKPGSG